MTLKQPRPRWLRRLRWFGIFIVCWIAIVPTLQALWLRHRVVSAIRSPQSIRLEEFIGIQLLTKVELTHGQYEAVASALPIRPDIGAPGMPPRLCWMPHHRVVMTNADGNEVSFEVCFKCDQVAFDKERIWDTPYLWRASLRKLFTDHGVPVRAKDEYTKLRLTERSQ
jgi:hypothetical protein